MNAATPSPGTAATITYRAFLFCAGVVALIAVVFFVIGLLDGSVSSFNSGIWFLLLTFLGAVIGAGLYLRSRGKTGLAIAVLSVVAVPGLLRACSP